MKDEAKVKSDSFDQMFKLEEVKTATQEASELCVHCKCTHGCSGPWEQ